MPTAGDFPEIISHLVDRSREGMRGGRSCRQGADHETSASWISAPCSGCCRAPGRVADRLGAILHVLADNPGSNVGPPAGGEGNNQRDRPARIGLRPSNARHRRQSGSTRCQMEKLTARTFHEVPLARPNGARKPARDHAAKRPIISGCAGRRHPRHHSLLAGPSARPGGSSGAKATSLARAGQMRPRARRERTRLRSPLAHLPRRRGASPRPN